MVPLGQLEVLQHTSMQMLRFRSQMPLRHWLLAVHAAPDTRLAVPDGTHEGMTL